MPRQIESSVKRCLWPSDQFGLHEPSWPGEDVAAAWIGDVGEREDKGMRRMYGWMRLWTRGARLVGLNNRPRTLSFVLFIMCS
jgi:hypothetical protein